jgi:hypothetical protein
MIERRRFKPTAPLDQRLTEQAERLLKEAQGTPPEMLEYRAYSVGHDGHFLKSVPLVCADDDEAEQ